MATQADVRRIALGLPQVKEAEGHFAFAVVGPKGKERGFVCAWLERVHPKKARVPSAAVVAVRVGSLEEKAALLQIGEDDERFFTEPHYDGYPAILVRLSKIKLAELRELIVAGWQVQAPKALVKAWSEKKPPAGGARSGSRRGRRS